MSGMGLEQEPDILSRLLLSAMVFFAVGAFFLIAGLNGELVLRIRTMQVWVGVGSSVLGVFFLTKFLSGLSTFVMFQNVTGEDVVFQSYIRDSDLV